ncbi:hypothetical protein [Alcanivorax sp.]|uniref:hypothetical protein n=1 Tax=Alcanivorax sp. TaxID=1872427 RepID=UPI000C4158EF|nr:hypothetical protein [Alcanivorax sp.]MBQ23623.1 hypothetical protein [Alcanivorax sp.]|tara:strand:+ start:825 stop:1232 length:408 start_codon:yes stop_codon:yes gene_type:complete
MPWTSLKNALLFNAACSALLGAALLLAPDVLASLMGEFSSLILTILGGTLLFFAADVAFVATRQPVSPGLAKMITVADLAWVLATPVVMLMGAPWLSFWGHVLLLDVALLVAFCALLQWRGLQRQVLQEQQGAGS